MPTVILKVTIKTADNNKEEYTVKALKRPPCLIYHEKDENKTKVIYDYKKNLLIRENSELYMEYEFKEDEITTAIIKVKSLNKYLNLSLKTTKLSSREDFIEVAFLLEEEKINYKLEVL